jgi:hypothetical protein
MDLVASCLPPDYILRTGEVYSGFMRLYFVSAVKLSKLVLRDVTLYGNAGRYQRLGGTYCLPSSTLKILTHIYIMFHLISFISFCVHKEYVTFLSLSMLYTTHLDQKHWLLWLIYFVLEYVGDPGSSVSIVSGCGLENLAIEVRSPAGAKDFSCSLCVQTGSGVHSASCTMGTGGPFPGGKARGGT